MLKPMFIKGILQRIFIAIIAIYLCSLVVSSLSYNQDLKILLLSATVFSLLNLILRPILKLVMLPINFITLGTISWLIGVFMLYITTYIVPGFTISAFEFVGFSSNGFRIPGANLNVFWTVTLCSFVISWLSRTITWLFES